MSTSPTYPDEVIAHGHNATHAELDAAVAAARAAAHDWARTQAHERGAILLRAAAAVDAAADRWGSELAREEGKPVAEAIGEVRRAAQILRYYGVEGDRPSGESYHSPRPGERILVTRKALGVVAVITPFNFPIAIPAWKIAPALALGNTVVWKPAEAVPLLAMRLMTALADAGLPAGVCNLVLGDRELGACLVEHRDINGVTFTGSTSVGRAIAASAAGRGIPVQAEMGGKNAAVVLDDADLGTAVDQVLAGAFRSAGQKCTATSRLVVTPGIADALLDELVARLGAWAVGDPLDQHVRIGPVVDRAAQASILAGIRGALDQNARVLFGGQPYVSGFRQAGCFVPPTILELEDTTAQVWRTELFGPVLAVHRAENSDHAFMLAADSEFGLSAAIFTNDLSRALGAVDDLDVGILHINSESAGADPHVPFGGAKASGYGPKEQGRAAVEFFTHPTTVYLRGGRSDR
ncbi:aldehyde dehydrogenase family protein [Nocardia callitridis]|uniref:Aldehyde dehydrogenase family protein n=1 Tax=Nocardia callitridis TaxID=648753 RepID=A0ABP9K8V5_9NOCA